MPQDAFTLKALSIELNELLKEGKVNKITQPTNDEVYLDIYSNRKNLRLILSANVVVSRVSITSLTKENPITAKNFCMLLRKHLLGAVIKKVSLLDFERVIKIDFMASNEFFDAISKTIYAEIMGKYSNIILVENDIILGAIKQAGFEEANLRPILAGLKYANPPKQEKEEPDSLNLKNILVQYEGGNLGDFIFEKVKGIAKTTAYQIVYEYFKKLDNQKLSEEEAENFDKFIKDFIFRPHIKPNVIINEKGLLDFFAVHYELIKAEKLIEFDKLYEAEEYFYSKKEQSKLFNEKKQKLLSAVNNEEKKFIKRTKIISEKESNCKDYERDKLFGELLLSYSYKLKDNEEFAEVENYYDNNNILKIKLDKNLTIKENSKKYYKKYNKEKRTIEAVSLQKQEIEKELDYIKSINSEIELITKTEDFKDIEEELIKAKILKAIPVKKSKKENEIQCYLYNIKGFSVKIGKNNVQNDKITSSARGKDIWLHTKKYHSAHGIIEIREKAVDIEVLKLTADIVAYYSEGRNGAKIEVDYTEKKNVKKPNGAKMGFVTYTGYKTVIVNPDKHEEFLKTK